MPECDVRRRGLTFSVLQIRRAATTSRLTSVSDSASFDAVFTLARNPHSERFDSAMTQLHDQL
jgi:hypothetical protein